MKNINLYLDCEWFLNQNLFLIGYAYNAKEFGQLYDQTLSYKHLEEIFKPATNYIFFYGPDIKMIEKFFNASIRKLCPCANLLRIFKVAMPGLSSYKLSDLEKKFGIERSTKEYKTDVFKLWHDWNNPNLRHLILKYNMEDVINMMRLKKIIFNKYQITNPDVNKLLL